MSQMQRVARATRDGMQVVADCPYCDGTHRHGLTDDLRAGKQSQRAADCGLGGYMVELGGER
jgi:hypothetical protein